MYVKKHVFVGEQHIIHSVGETCSCDLSLPVYINFSNLITSFFVGHIDLMTGKNQGPTVGKWNEPQYSCYSITDFG